MKLTLKKSALALVALGLSSVALAASYTPEPAPAACQTASVTAPCEATAWDIGFDAMYLEPVSDGWTYANYDSAAPVHTNYYNVQPGYDFGFRVHGSYHFEHGKDVSIHWTYFDQKDHEHVTNATTANVGSQLLNGTDFNTVKGTVKNDLNAVYLEMGQHIDVGDSLDMRFNVGGQYISLDNSVTAYGTRTANGNTETAKTSSDFTGFGPRAGLGVEYHIANGLSFVARGAVGMAVGDVDSHFHRDILTAPSTHAHTYAHAKNRKIVGTQDADLALNYTHAMDQGDLSLEAGWHFNQLHRAQIFLNDGVSDFGIHGPYLGVHWVGNLA